ncbi:BspA family leucine-rich repeat surface protein [Mycoplasma mycoides]|uniref:BspA family leucine-rich repeat surface protein n=1 Tax=Mycoplasma mycoides TaxID=2102 RepID=UPI002240526B|nr:BspA family leucine-rich repeat surface protein [Mycoplasma mycoides]QVK05058.1 BspA family leucine-rich repeat surface protein [Mycoplasma mycoides subsp. capri]
MKKLLTLLTSCSFGFLITTSIILVNKNNGENNIQINKQITKKDHKYQGEKLTEVGYYWDNHEKQVRIQKIPPTIKVIAAPLPKEITSLKGAFSTRSDDVTWQVEWDTKNIKNMNSMFFNTTWFNSSSIVNWDTSNVTDMGQMFGRTGSFNQDLSKWNVSKVKNFKEMFSGAKEFNNGGKPLNWKDKLGSAENMEAMFQDASNFKHSLSDWKLEKKVNNKNFGLSPDKHPKWKEEEMKPSGTTSPSNSLNSENISSRSDESELNEILSPTPSPSVVPAEPNNNLTPTTPNNEEMKDEPSTGEKALEIPIKPGEPNTLDNIDEVETPAESKQPDELENNDVKKENETSIEDKSKRLKKDIYKTPLVKPNTIIKPTSPNIAVITGSVLGIFIILGIGAGVGYYYRKNLKNFYLKSTDKIKPVYLKSKNDLKSFYNKIKDKISKK